MNDVALKCRVMMIIITLAMFKVMSIMMAVGLVWIPPHKLLGNLLVLTEGRASERNEEQQCVRKGRSYSSNCESYLANIGFEFAELLQLTFPS